MFRRHTLKLPFVLAAVSTSSAEAALPPGTVTVPTHKNFKALLAALDQAVASNKMLVVARASASQGAAARGIMILGNEVVMVFRNDFAVRMLRASIPAGIEAPCGFMLPRTRMPPPAWPTGNRQRFLPPTVAQIWTRWPLSWILFSTGLPWRQLRKSHEGGGPPPSWRHQLTR